VGFSAKSKGQCGAVWVRKHMGNLDDCQRSVESRQSSNELCRFVRQSGEAVDKVVKFLGCDLSLFEKRCGTGHYGYKGHGEEVMH